MKDNNYSRRSFLSGVLATGITGSLCSGIVSSCAPIGRDESVFANKKRDINILDLGAQPDGITLCTEIIQNAVDQVSESGGGTVIFPPGKYLTGSLIIKNGVTLEVKTGAILLGSTNINDYLNIQPEYVALRTTQPTKQLIFAEGQSNISIIGAGIIDGQGAAFERAAEGDDPGVTRPHLIQFINCKNILIEGLTLLNSGGWMQHYLACDKLHIRGINVYNHCNYNNDGIDIDGCHDVMITDCIINSDDDGLCLKSTSPQLCKNVVISNCVIKSHCGALKLGTESTGGFQNINISNCTISPTLNNTIFYGSRNGLAAISVEMVDGGLLDGVVISNIVISETDCPIFVRLGNRARKYTHTVPEPEMGTLQNVIFSNIIATTSSKTTSNITGIPGRSAENISLNNIIITNLSKGSYEEAERVVPERDKAYPSAAMFGNVLPASGFFVRHVKNIVFDNVQLILKDDNVRPAFIFNDAHDVKLKYPVVYSNKTDIELIRKDTDCSNIHIIH